MENDCGTGDPPIGSEEPFRVVTGASVNLPELHTTMG